MATAAPRAWTYDHVRALDAMGGKARSDFCSRPRPTQRNKAGPSCSIVIGPTLRLEQPVDEESAKRLLNKRAVVIPHKSQAHHKKFTCTSAQHQNHRSEQAKSESSCSSTPDAAH